LVLLLIETRVILIINLHFHPLSLLLFDIVPRVATFRLIRIMDLDDPIILAPIEVMEAAMATTVLELLHILIL
jgi:hypothetical protein